MKKLFLVLATLALIFSFVSYRNKESKTEEKEIVKIEKNHDKALLLVTFGSTGKGPHKTYANILNKYKETFPDHDIYLAFTSTICITRWGAKTGEYFSTPDKWLTAMANHGYKNILVQSLHVMPGEEFQLLRDNYVGNFKKEYPSIPIALGKPLLYSDDDIETVGDALIKEYKSKIDSGQVIAFMGHGNPKPQFNGDKNVNVAYEKIRDYMQKTYPNNILVGTVDYMPMLIDTVLKELTEKVAKGTIINLAPLMSIAGDHANNDMSGDEDTNEKPEDQSWKVQIKKEGYTVNKENCILKGLGDYPAVLDVWINHTKTILGK